MNNEDYARAEKIWLSLPKDDGKKSRKDLFIEGYCQAYVIVKIQEEIAKSWDDNCDIWSKMYREKIESMYIDEKRTVASRGTSTSVPGVDLTFNRDEKNCSNRFVIPLLMLAVITLDSALRICFQVLTK